MKYFEWLCGLIELPQPYRSYHLLYKELYKTEFIWMIPHDDNRLMDGKALREQYKDETINHTVNFFEVSIGLCYRIEDIMHGHPENKTIGGWFHMLICNLKLDVFTDDEFSNAGTRGFISRILQNCMTRQYKFNGEGGFFPLKVRKKDQRKVEIWYQMSEFLNENYFI
jgi:hypothetical protein